MVEKNRKTYTLPCNKTVLACGGIGGQFKNSTNQRNASGDAIAIAYKHGIVMKNLNYIQFHPTALYEPVLNGRRFLISESVRGEGAYLLNLDKKRFIKIADSLRNASPLSMKNAFWQVTILRKKVYR